MSWGNSPPEYLSVICETTEGNLIHQLLQRTDRVVIKEGFQEEFILDEQIKISQGEYAWEVVVNILSKPLKI